MSFKNIIAALAPTADKQAGSAYAISMAQVMGAHVTCCAYALHPQGNSLPWFPDELIENHLAKVTEGAHLAIQQFKETARQSDIETASEVFRATLDAATTAFGERARTFDITILTQSAKGLDHAGDLFTEAALFYSGRPLILIPRDHTGAFAANRVLIAWDGSQYAAVAVAHAMPVLRLADKVEILVVGDQRKADSTQAAKLVASLERHGMDVELICRDENDDADAILREAQGWGASLLVMGGYGHSRAREIVFGGVTRFMMSEAPLPVLMAH